MFEFFKNKNNKIKNKVEKYIQLESEWDKLNEDISEAAIEYNTRKREYDSLKKSEINSPVSISIQQRFKNFDKSHLKNIGLLKKRRDNIMKSMRDLINGDSEFALLIEEEKKNRKLKTILSKYRSNDIELSVCDTLLKSITKEKTKYADNIILNEKGQILLLKRSELDESKPGYYTIPGGHVDMGEDCETAAKRELKEEAGIDAPDNINKVGEYEDEKVKIEYYQSNVENVEPVLQEEEIWSYEWVDLKDLKNYKLPFNMSENLDKILFPFKHQVIKIKKSFEDGFLNKKQKDILLKNVIEKAKSGIYKNTLENRKLGRVGQKYGKTEEEYKQYTDEKDNTDDEKEVRNKLKEVNDNLSKLNDYLNEKYKDLSLLSRSREKFKDEDYKNFISLKEQLTEKLISLSKDNKKKEIKEDSSDYKMAHRPTDDSPSSDNVTKGDLSLPTDFYDHPEKYGNIKDVSYKESFDALKKIKDNPEAEITIYRSTIGDSINDGDWVTFSKNYAKSHNESNLDNKGKILSLKVKAKDVIFAGDDIREFGYFPKEKDTQKSEENDIQKAWKKHPIGTIITRKDGQKYKKVSETGNSKQDWQPVKEGKQPNQDENNHSKQRKQEENKDNKPTEEELKEHAKNTSETALNNAIKQSPDPEVRQTAHEELKRREEEEKPQEEKLQEEKEGEEKEDQENEYVEKFRQLSDDQVKFYLEAPYPKVKEAAKMVANERGLSIVSNEDYIKQFKNFDLSDEYDEKFEKHSHRFRLSLLKDKSPEEQNKILEEEKSSLMELEELKKQNEQNRKEVKEVYNDKSKKVLDYLSKNEEINNSLEDYLSYGFEQLRLFLTNVDRFKLSNKLKDESAIEYRENQSNNLSKLIQNNKIDQDLTLYRMVNTDTNFFINLEEGNIYEDKSFSSSSLIKQKFFGDFTIKILAKKGSSVSNVNNSGELEYLIDKGSKFRVIEKKDYGITVELL